MPLLTPHDRHTLRQLVERHIEFVVRARTARRDPVALPSVFLDHCAVYRDAKLPRVGATVTAPR